MDPEDPMDPVYPRYTVKNNTPDYYCLGKNHFWKIIVGKPCLENRFWKTVFGKPCLENRVWKTFFDPSSMWSYRQFSPTVKFDQPTVLTYYFSWGPFVDLGPAILQGDHLRMSSPPPCMGTISANGPRARWLVKTRGWRNFKCVILGAFNWPRNRPFKSIWIQTKTQFC